MINILGYFDVGYNDDSAEVITEIIVRCGNPADRSAVDIAIFCFFTLHFIYYLSHIIKVLTFEL